MSGKSGAARLERGPHTDAHSGQRGRHPARSIGAILIPAGFLGNAENYVGRCSFPIGSPLHCSLFKLIDELHQAGTTRRRNGIAQV